MKHNKKRQYFNEEEKQVFGRLTLTGKSYFRIEPSGKRRRMVEAICECGNVRDYLYSLLTRGDTSSCGCFRKEVVSETLSAHKLSKHPLYIVYAEIKQRCFYIYHKSYEDYGGRGIIMCDEWVNSFQAFYDWCISNGWVKGMLLDRRNNDGNYEPSNCRFVTIKVSNRNTRRNRFYTAFGETKCLWDWGLDERCKVGVWALRRRMDIGTWDDRFEEALTTPALDMKNVGQTKKNNLYLTAFGETKCMSAWLEDERCLVKIDSLRDRLAKGWDAEKSMGTAPTRNGKNSK